MIQPKHQAEHGSKPKAKETTEEDAKAPQEQV
jgi:hypothetical protein